MTQYAYIWHFTLSERHWGKMKLIILKWTILYYALDTIFFMCPKYLPIRSILFGIVINSEETSRKVSSVPLVFFPEFDCLPQVGLSVFVRDDPSFVFPVVEGLTGNAYAFREFLEVPDGAGFGKFLELEEPFFTAFDAWRAELDDVSYANFLVLCSRCHIAQTTQPLGVDAEIIDVVVCHRAQFLNDVKVRGFEIDSKLIHIRIKGMGKAAP